MGTGPVLLLAGRTKKSIMDDMNDTKQVVRHVVADTFTLFYLKRWVVFFLLSIHSWSSERQRRSDAKRLTVMAWPQTKPSNALRCHCVPQPAKRTA